MASLTINPPPPKRLKTSANTQDNNTSSKIKTISLVPFIDEFINTMYDKLSSNGTNGELTPENKKDVLERMEAIVHHKVTQQGESCIKKVVKRDFSKLPGIDDICVKTIIPYLGNDGQALMNMFGKTTKRFLTVPTIRDTYNKNISNCYRNVLNRLNDRYETEFPDGAPLVCACEKGRFEDVKLFITCMNGSNNNMTLKEYVNQEDKNSGGWACTPLMIAARNEHFQIAKYLVEIIYPHASKVEKKYYAEFPKGTPIVCACEKGRFEDVKLLIAGHDVNGSNGNNNNNMTLKEYVNQVGKDSWGFDRYTPLMAAAVHEHFQVVKYLIEQCEADPNITGNAGWNALHCAVNWNEKNTELIDFLLTNMSLNSINKKDVDGETPLDNVYDNDSPIKQTIINLICSKGGKANRYDANGRDIGPGNGDLNVGRHAVITGSDIEVVREALTKVDDINEMNDIYRETVLDLVYRYNDSPIKQEIIDLLRSKGGKANRYDADGSLVGPGNGDLND